MRFATASGTLIGFASLVFLASGVDAKGCGDGVACGCGDTVRGTAVLEADLRDCGNDGLRLKGDAVLDCAGHEIAGSGKGEGILLDQAVGAVVRRCAVVNFKTGIRIRGGRENVVAENEISGSKRYGVELAKATIGNLVERNLVVESGDEGVHIGTGAHGTVVVGNEIRGSRRENLYVLSSDRGVFAGNRLSDSGDASIYAKHSSENVFSSNEVDGHVVHVRGHSIANAFVDNTVRGGRFVFEAYKDKHPAAVKGWTRPADNRVEGGAVLDTKTCFQFKGSSYNQATGIAANGCKAKRQQKKGGVKSTSNTVSLASSEG